MKVQSLPIRPNPMNPQVARLVLLVANPRLNSNDAVPAAPFPSKHSREGDRRTETVALMMDNGCNGESGEEQFVRRRVMCTCGDKTWGNRSWGLAFDSIPAQEPLPGVGRATSCPISSESAALRAGKALA